MLTRPRATYRHFVASKPNPILAVLCRPAKQTADETQANDEQEVIIEAGIIGAGF